MSDVLARGEIRINVERKKAYMATLIGIILELYPVLHCGDTQSGWNTS